MQKCLFFALLRMQHSKTGIIWEIWTNFIRKQQLQLLRCTDAMSALIQSNLWQKTQKKQKENSHSRWSESEVLPSGRCFILIFFQILEKKAVVKQLVANSTHWQWEWKKKQKKGRADTSVCLSLPFNDKYISHWRGLSIWLQACRVPAALPKPAEAAAVPSPLHTNNTIKVWERGRVSVCVRLCVLVMLM